MGRRGTRGLAAAVLALGAWWGVLAAAAPPAAAHAVLVSTTPADGARLDASPGRVAVELSEAVTPPPQAVRVLDARGERVDLGDVGSGDHAGIVEVGVPEPLPEGVYTVSWRVVSADGHPVQGAYVFVVGDPPDAAAAVPVVADDGQAAWAVVGGLVRFTTYAGALLAAGGALFVLAVHDGDPTERRRLARLLAAALAAGAVATVLGVPLQAVLQSGLPRALVDPALLGAVVAGPAGASAGVRLLGLALLALGLRAPAARRGGRVLAGIGGMLAVASFTLSGHTVTAEDPLLANTANVVHTAAGAVWFGGLVLLAVVLRARRGRADAVGGARLVARFSGWATLALVLVSAAGTALAWTEVRRVAALTSTPYGWTLVVKVALVAGVAAMGAYNHRRLVPSIRRAAGEGTAVVLTPAWARLSRVVRVESYGIVAVLVLTAALVNLVPARTAAGIGEPFSQVADLDGEHRVQLVVDPNRAGRNEVHLYLLDTAGRPAEIAQAVALHLALPDAEVAPIQREPSRLAPGHYVHTGPELAITGTWEVTVAVDLSDFERRQAVFAVPVGR